MKKILLYGITSALIFGAGACYEKNEHKKQLANKKYDTFTERGNWYLSTPIGSKIINENHQVGTVEERMRGLLKDEYGELKESLEKIVKKN